MERTVQKLHSALAAGQRLTLTGSNTPAFSFQGSWDGGCALHSLAMALAMLGRLAYPIRVSQSRNRADAAFWKRVEPGALVLAVLAQPAISAATARSAASAMAGYVDGVIFVPATPHASLLRHVVDAYVAACTEGVVDRPWRAPIGTEFLDLSASFAGTAQASVGVGQATGAARSDRARRTVQQAIAGIGTAQLSAATGVLILLAGGRSLRLHEIADTTYAIHAVSAHGAVQVLAVQNDVRLGDALRVTVIAAGPSN